jgi:hypothetical protein
MLFASALVKYRGVLCYQGARPLLAISWISIPYDEHQTKGGHPYLI